MNVIVRIKVRQRQRRGLLRHGQGKNELESLSWWGRRLIKKVACLVRCATYLEKQMAASFSRLQDLQRSNLAGAPGRPDIYCLLDNKDTLGGEGGSCAKRRSTQRSFEIEILLLPSLPSFVIF